MPSARTQVICIFCALKLYSMGSYLLRIYFWFGKFAVSCLGKNVWGMRRERLLIFKFLNLLIRIDYIHFWPHFHGWHNPKQEISIINRSGTNKMSCLKCRSISSVRSCCLTKSKQNLYLRFVWRIKYIAELRINGLCTRQYLWYGFWLEALATSDINTHSFSIVSFITT